MPDESKPGDFTFGVNKDGDIVMDGEVIERNRNTYADIYNDVPSEEEEKPEAVVEKVVPEAAPEPPPETPPDPPKISEKQRFKLMVRGEFQEKEYSPDEIIARLQMAESYDLRNDELRKKHQKIEPFLNVFERPDFREWMETKIAVGDIPAPTPPPPVSNRDIIEYRLRTVEPEYKEIHQQVIAWAATLPDQEAGILDSDHSAYVRAYDQFKANRKAATPSAAPVVPQKNDIEKALANKEVVKQQARIEPPGGATPVEEGDPKRAYEKEERRLRNAVKNRERHIMYKGRTMDPEDAWIMHRLGD